jgi:hypothetical protein
MSWGYNKNYGKVGRIYIDENNVFFRLKDGKTEMNPTSGYYVIQTSHKNYSSLVGLLLTAASNRYTIYVRTKETLNPQGHAEVYYLVVDW